MSSEHPPKRIVVITDEPTVKRSFKWTKKKSALKGGQCVYTFSHRMTANFPRLHVYIFISLSINPSLGGNTQMIAPFVKVAKLILTPNHSLWRQRKETFRKCEAHFEGAHCRFLLFCCYKFRRVRRWASLVHFICLFFWTPLENIYEFPVIVQFLRFFR